MAMAYVFVQAEPQMANKVRGAVLRLPGVRSAEKVTGPYDIVVVAEGRDLQELHDVVIGSMQAIEGILRALPCVARSWTLDEGGN
jgi:nitrate reductase NapAB chaperone NapD